MPRTVTVNVRHLGAVFLVAALAFASSILLDGKPKRVPDHNGSSVYPEPDSTRFASLALFPLPISRATASACSCSIAALRV